MPRRQRATKDAASRDSPWVGAGDRRSMGFRMEQSGAARRPAPRRRQIGAGRETGGSETSQYPEEKKSTEIPQVAASERGEAQTGGFIRRGSGTATSRRQGERSRLERRAAEGDSPVREAGPSGGRIPSRAGHVKPRPNPWGPSHKAEYCCRPIANEYREGKVKRTPSRGVKETLKSCAP